MVVILGSAMWCGQALSIGGGGGDMKILKNALGRFDVLSIKLIIAEERVQAA